MYTFLQNEQLVNPNQSGFRLSHSCVNQLPSITHESFQSFDTTPPLSYINFFRYIKDFSQSLVWHEGLLCKLNSIGITCKFYKLMDFFFLNDFKKLLYMDKPHRGEQILLEYLKGPYLDLFLFLNLLRTCLAV